MGMKIDLTVELTKDRLDHLMARSSKKGLMSVGHFGTHFDAMGKTFPLDFTESRGIVFDVSSIEGRELDAGDNDFVVHLYPWNVKDFTGVPSRVIAELA